MPQDYKNILPKPGQPLRIFAYGSLIWKPAFEITAQYPATATGLRRQLCIYSWKWRGTPENPGLVLGLLEEDGIQCDGVIHEASLHDTETAAKTVWDREMVTGVYHPVIRSMTADNGNTYEVVCFVADTEHEQFAGVLSIQDQIAFTKDATGDAGSAKDYVCETAKVLSKNGIIDETLETVAGYFKEPIR